MSDRHVYDVNHSGYGISQAGLGEDRVLLDVHHRINTKINGEEREEYEVEGGEEEEEEEIDDEEEEEEEIDEVVNYKETQKPVGNYGGGYGNGGYGDDDDDYFDDGVHPVQHGSGSGYNGVRHYPRTGFGDGGYVGGGHGGYGYGQRSVTNITYPDGRTIFVNTNIQKEVNNNNKNTGSTNLYPKNGVIGSRLIGGKFTMPTSKKMTLQNKNKDVVTQQYVPKGDTVAEHIQVSLLNHGINEKSLIGCQLKEVGGGGGGNTFTVTYHYEGTIADAQSRCELGTGLCLPLFYDGGRMLKRMSVYKHANQGGILKSYGQQVPSGNFFKMLFERSSDAQYMITQSTLIRCKNTFPFPVGLGGAAFKTKYNWDQTKLAFYFPGRMLNEKWYEKKLKVVSRGRTGGLQEFFAKLKSDEIGKMFQPTREGKMTQVHFKTEKEKFLHNWIRNNGDPKVNGLKQAIHQSNMTKESYVLMNSSDAEFLKCNICDQKRRYKNIGQRDFGIKLYRMGCCPGRGAVKWGKIHKNPSRHYTKVKPKMTYSIVFSIEYKFNIL